MNFDRVKDLVNAASKNKVFLMAVGVPRALWSRCFQGGWRLREGGREGGHSSQHLLWFTPRSTFHAQWRRPAGHRHVLPAVSPDDAERCLPNEDGAKGSIQVVAVAARNVERAQEFGKKHSIRAAYGSYVELARDPNIDVVYIGVIHPYHLKSCLLFMDAKKNVLCEKPLAMNAREVKEILDSAKRNNVFLMEAVWSRFFPASVEIRRSLAQGELGEVKMVRAEFGLPRSMDKNLGAGTMLDLGIYPLQFSMMVYGGEKPESIKATGVCTETGVDETTAVTLKFSKGRMAVITCSSGVELDNDAVIVGTKGTIRIPAHMWCPTSVVVNGKESRYPVPESDFTLNFLNSTGMSYEAEAVRQCLLKGLKESPVMSHADSLTLAEVEDEVRRQVGVVYSQDSG